MIEPEKIIETLKKNGYAVIDLPDDKPVRAARELVRGEIQRLLRSDTVDLETYHEYVEDEDRHLEIHMSMAEFAKSNRLSKSILLGQMSLFSQIFGPDIAMTVPDVLRIARPGKHCDNLGFHRDFDYGNTAYELNLFVPLVGLDSRSGLAVVPGSHTFEESELEIVNTAHPTIKKGSVRHQLGLMHSPKVIVNLDREAFYVPDVFVGQSLVFVPHCIHGQEVNAGTVTRWSLDFEICNSLAPVNWKTTAGTPRFEVVSESFFTYEGRRKHGFSS